MGKLLLIFVIGFGLSLSNDQWRSTIAGYFNKLISSDSYSSKPEQAKPVRQNQASSNTYHYQPSSSNSYSSKGRTRGALVTNRTNITAELRKNSAGYQLSQERSKNAQAFKNSGASLSLQQSRQQNQSALKQGSNNVSASLAQERMKIQNDLLNY